MNNLLHWIWLSLSLRAGGKSFKKLYERFGSVTDIYNADEKDIASVIGSRCFDYNSLVDKNLDEAEKVLNFCRTKSVGILVYADENYPQRLREISNPPVLLYYRGNLPDFKNELCISVVGTRYVSDYGRKNAFYVSRDLAKAGATVVSGMAIGIDGVALAAALSEGKATVAVIGSGIDVCYPPQHKRLAREIVKRGCVMTEHAPGTKPNRQNFPTRNRIISGLSEATVVIEGNERSGALITARRAFRQGRTVYALPGNVGNRNSEGTNLLIKNGAKAFSSADDIVRDFEHTHIGKLNPFKLLTPSSKSMASVLCEYEVEALSPGDKVFIPSGKKRAKTEAPETKIPEKDNSELLKKLSKLDTQLRNLYERIPNGEIISQDSLVSDDVPMRELMRALLKLEVAGLVTLLPGEMLKKNT
ncbi:MAG: DNA-processing protein DprA [Clostridia bacterium]|nr:DNA-processing protein DprA [Clostridia bacterium]